MFGGLLKIKTPSWPFRTGGKERWTVASARPQNFIPGLLIGFLCGLLLNLSSSTGKRVKRSVLSAGKRPERKKTSSGDPVEEEFKMVLVVRQDLKMGAGKIASQCAHASTGIYGELMQRQVGLLRGWEQCGQPKIVVTCKNQREMKSLRESAESVGLPTFIVADAGRTQVSSGSKTVLAIGPGRRTLVDSVTGNLHLL